jgi:type II/III secretion system protein
VIRHLTAFALGVAAALMPLPIARAQQPAAPTVAPAAPAVAPWAQPVPLKEGALLKVQVVVSRYQGEKKVSSQPYTLSVTANGPRANLRMGLQVAVPTAPAAATDNKFPPAVVYRDVGTSIDCVARSLDDGRFRLELSIDDSSLAADDQSPQPFAKGIPQFRSFRISGTTVLRDGQSTQFTSAAEKVTGEIAKVDVTLNVIK